MLYTKNKKPLGYDSMGGSTTTTVMGVDFKVGKQNPNHVPTQPAQVWDEFRVHGNPKTNNASIVFNGTTKEKAIGNRNNPQRQPIVFDGLITESHFAGGESYRVTKDIVNGYVNGKPNVVVKAGEILKENITEVFIFNKMQKGIQLDGGANSKVFIPIENLEAVYAETNNPVAKVSATLSGMPIATKVLLAVAGLLILFLIFHKE